MRGGEREDGNGRIGRGSEQMREVENGGTYLSDPDLSSSSCLVCLLDVVLEVGDIGCGVVPVDGDEVYLAI